VLSYCICNLSAVLIGHSLRHNFSFCICNLNAVLNEHSLRHSFSYRRAKFALAGWFALNHRSPGFILLSAAQHFEQSINLCLFSRITTVSRIHVRSQEELERGNASRG